MKKYSDYTTRDELLSDANFAFEIVKEYLIKMDAPVSKFRSLLDIQKYLNDHRKNPFVDEEEFKSNAQNDLEKNEEEELRKNRK